MKNTTENIKKYGLTDRFIAEATLHRHLYIGRIISQSKDLYRVICDNTELMAEVSGKFRYNTQKPSDYPAVGDFILLDRCTGQNGNAIIHHMLTRKSAFIRKAPGTANDEQIIAANIDTVFICMALNKDFNLRRLERYLSIGWDSGAVPVVVLTKSDLCDDIAGRLKDINTVCIGADILITSAVTKDALHQIKPYLTPGKTVAFIGSSGVGKSTLINRLMGENILDTAGLRNDDKGRHTTTKRELILLKDGGMVIDTPGMRELGLESADLSKTFSDIDTLAKQCKFRDCTHKNEPGCAVKKSIEQGILSTERLSSYQKLKKEAKYEGLNSKQIETLKLNEMFSSVGGMKNVKKFIKEKNKRK